MEESISLLDLIKQSFELKEVDIRAYSPLTLAYIGDCVYDLVIRTVVVERGNEPANKLHKKTVTYVKAQTQAAMIEALLPYLTEEEEAVYKRGRNAKSYTSAKNASIGDYRKATGMEALVGYLYLTGQEARIMELIKTGLKELSMTL
ncbi:MAG: ribonuclease III [Lachnospiraceae bacterium]|nr:ribonuclease III [Lachnospiraceae bacterium]